MYVTCHSEWLHHLCHPKTYLWLWVYQKLPTDPWPWRLFFRFYELRACQVFSIFLSPAFFREVAHKYYTSGFLSSCNSEDVFFSFPWLKLRDDGPRRSGLLRGGTIMAALGEVPLLLPTRWALSISTSPSIPNLSLIKFLTIASVSSHVFSSSSSGTPVILMLFLLDDF